MAMMCFPRPKPKGSDRPALPRRRILSWVKCSKRSSSSPARLQTAVRRCAPANASQDDQQEPPYSGPTNWFTRAPGQPRGRLPTAAVQDQAINEDDPFASIAQRARSPCYALPHSMRSSDAFDMRQLMRTHIQDLRNDDRNELSYGPIRARRYTNGSRRSAIIASIGSALKVVVRSISPRHDSGVYLSDPVPRMPNFDIDSDDDYSYESDDGQSHYSDQATHGSPPMEPQRNVEVHSTAIPIRSRMHLPLAIRSRSVIPVLRPHPPRQSRPLSWHTEREVEIMRQSAEGELWITWEAMQAHWG